MEMERLKNNNQFAIKLYENRFKMNTWCGMQTNGRKRDGIISTPKCEYTGKIVHTYCLELFINIHAHKRLKMQECVHHRP